MKTKRPRFEGFWYVTAQEFRVAGEWRRECGFEPDGWVIAFRPSRETFAALMEDDRAVRLPEPGQVPNGRYGEIFRPMDGRTAGDWTFDAMTGIISILYDKSGAVGKCVFRETGKGTCLFFYDDMQHIPPDMREIIGYHAHMRYELVRS